MELDKNTLLVMIASLQLIDEKIEQMVGKATMLQDQIVQLVDDIRASELSINTEELASIKQGLRKNNLLDFF